MGILVEVGSHSHGGADFHRGWPEGTGDGTEGQDIQFLFETQLLINETLYGRTAVAQFGAWLQPCCLDWPL
jgi:hypothetical protein